ncbi:hypothetical protein Rhal01_03451 [Rubritalea halochordaticola]|uniref:DUF2262 domain-containing protein n=1 Tax=Rubritalea halochordaticola TaxID=714537 RepID=A0ABP9V3M7_9BACT
MQDEYRDEKLGPLKLNPNTGHIEGKRKWMLKLYKLCIIPDSEGGYDSEQVHAKARFAELNLRKFYQHIVDSHYATFLRQYATQGPITQKEFTRRLALHAIHIHPNGNTDLTFKDGGLFRGRYLRFTYKESGDLTTAKFVSRC